MKVVHISLNDIPSFNLDTLVLGYFDALHLGHIALINKAKSLSSSIGLMTFSKNPKAVLLDKEVEEINSLKERSAQMASLGVNTLIVLEVNKEVFSLSKEDFITKIIDKINPKNIVCGYDYTYAKNKEGNVETLKALGKFNIYEVKPILNGEGKKISSTYIKELLKDGQIEKVNSYLYEDFSLTSKVVEGNKIGRTINFKTANLDLKNKYVLPKRGVYAGICIYEGNKYKCMINVGIHPTIKELDRDIVEVNILDFNKDIYNETIKVIFKYKIRDEKKFSSLEELKLELTKNKEETSSLIHL